jgi:predicted nuclease of restriction endonuclease-like (RecB) superfamily
MGNQSSLFPDNYDAVLNALKQRIRQAQLRAALAVNQELILLYWHIGSEILDRQQAEGWGTKVVERLARDLKIEFPDVKGFSRTNLLYMRAFAEAYPDEQVVQRTVGLIPWRHNIALIDKLKLPEERLWYAQQALENGWSRDILAMQIETNLYQRQGGAITNFDRTMPDLDSEIAQQLTKDPYNFDFISLTGKTKEQDLEKALVERIRDFLLELGVGFAFVGNQYPIVVDRKEYRLDLLFYHTKLHCYVVIDLKMGEFEPEYSGKMNFYVSAVDKLLCTPGDGRTIGIILCRSKSQTIVEFALQDLDKPIGVASYLLREDLPTELQGSLPTIEQLEVEMATIVAAIEANEKSD